jgi:hypothetical protein
VEDVVEVITSFVSPDDWRNNGGDVAQLNVVGDRLFVKAPRRMHPQVKWIIEQLPAAGAARGQGALPPGGVPAAGEKPARPQGRGHAAPAEGAGPAPGAEPAERSSRAYPVERLNSVNVLQMLVEAWGQGGRLEGPVELNTVGGTLTISGAKADVMELDRLLSFLSGERRPPVDADRELDIPSKWPSAAPAAPEPQVVYLDGQVPRPGAFAVPDKDFSLRRLLAAAGGLPGNATEVVITRSRNGKSKELHRLTRAALLEPAGEDPVLAGGDQVTVR